MLHGCNMSLSPLPSLAFVAGLLLVATGCGGNSNDTEDQSPSPPAEMEPPSRASPAEVLRSAERSRAARPAPPSEAELRAARRARYVEAVQSVDTLLERNCGACHGKSVPTLPCGLRFDHTDDLEALGLIAPLSADASRVVQVIVDGSMPPPGVQPRPVPSELEQLRAFIEGDASFWSRPGGDDRNARAYGDARSNACDAPPEPGVDAGAPDAGLASS
jgi:hypothetical protein